MENRTIKDFLTEEDAVGIVEIILILVNNYLTSSM